MQPKANAAEHRSGNRKTVAIQAQISDPEGDVKCACLLMDASRTGCRLYCDCIETLPDDVMLHPEGLADPIKASIVWRKPMFAGLAFKWPEKQPVS